MERVVAEFDDFPSLMEVAGLLHDAEFGVHDILYDDRCRTFRLRLRADWLADTRAGRAACESVSEHSTRQDVNGGRFELVFMEVDDCKIICEDPFLESYPSFVFSTVRRSSQGILWLLTHYVVRIRLRVDGIRGKLVALCARRAVSSEPSATTPPSEER